VVAAIVAVLAVMFPGLGIGQTTESHGGTPSGVFMQTNPDVCAVVGLDEETAMEQQLTLASPSHLLVYFSYGWGSLGTHEEGKLAIRLDGQGPTLNFPGNPPGRQAGTLMFSFANVGAGSHTVDVSARVDPIPSSEHPPVAPKTAAGVGPCALTVFVMPVAA